ncbi:hypothetical protein TIFTF001_052073, partial [Ficus carica]
KSRRSRIETVVVSWGNHDGLPGDRRGLSPVVVLHATTVTPGEWPSW